ncbi:hypothetical protein N8K70_03160 [Microbacterium betulae]|uniref:Uncharacterized protein n=1 Tax=Microbacterium betulae TaxID=2981139 RepID=A0AA97FHJ4_9MICO|nr:hypothetical protein [Microbacterium sp. AB]WOF23691.1 hypothetical protein N8K70_03160 [Microbacterium sp. AB]
MSQRSIHSTATRLAAAAAAALVLAAAGCSATTEPSPDTTASDDVACAAPFVLIDSVEVPEADSITVTISDNAVELSGEGWLACNDTNDGPTAVPWTDVDIVWRQETRTSEPVLAEIDESGAFSLTLDVPPEFTAGPASLVLTVPDYRRRIDVDLTAG